MRPRRAFTLIELLVVIAVIAVLMAILMPALSRAREQGKRTVCMNNLKQLAFAWGFYADDNGERIVNAITVPGTAGHTADEPCWLYFYNETLEKLRIEGVQKGALYPYVNQIKPYKCPTGIRGEVNTYAIVDSMNGAEFPGCPSSSWYITKRTQIKRPGDRAVFVDEGKTSTQSWTIYHDREQWWDSPPVRHGAGTNWGFADGHVEYWKWQDNRTLKLARQEPGIGPEQSGNPDIPRVQLAAWGKLAYTPKRN